MAARYLIGIISGVLSQLHFAIMFIFTAVAFRRTWMLFLVVVFVEIVSVIRTFWLNYSILLIQLIWWYSCLILVIESALKRGVGWRSLGLASFDHAVRWFALFLKLWFTLLLIQFCWMLFIKFLTVKCTVIQILIFISRLNLNVLSPTCHRAVLLNYCALV